MRAEFRRIQIGDIGNALMLLAEVYADARRALAEFVSNSADAFDLCRREGIWKDFVCEIELQERKGVVTSVTVKDNGVGIPYERLLELPERVAFSLKRGDPRVKGHKGIGLLAFGSFCENMRIVSRAHGRPETYIAEWSRESLRDPERNPVRIELVKDRALRTSGTQVHLTGVSADKQHHLKKSKLIDFLKSEFAPDLRQKHYGLFILDSAGKTQVQPGRYPGILFDQLQVKTTKNEAISLDIYLSQKQAIQKLGLFVRGKLVIEDISTHPDFSHDPWTLGHTCGELRCDFLRPITGRVGGVEMGPEWSRFREALFAIEARLSEKIGEIVEEQQSRQARRIFKELNQALAAVWKNLDWDRLPPSWTGTGPEAASFESGDGGVGAGIGSGKAGITGPPEASQAGMPKKPRLIDPDRPRSERGKGSPSFNWREAEFEPDSAHLRSRHIPAQSLIEINISHRDYLTERDEEDRHRNYLIRLASKEIALLNFRDMGETEVTERMIELETRLAGYFKR